MKKQILITTFVLLTTICAKAQTLPKLIPFRDGNKWGYVDSAKNVIIPIQFEDASPFLFNGYALVKEKGKLAYIDEKGAKVKDLTVAKEIEPHYIEKYQIKEEKGLYGVVDTLGNVIVPFQYDAVIGFDNFGLAAVKKNKKCGFVNERGEVIIQLKYDDVGVVWCDKLNRITINKKEGYIDVYGTEYFRN